ncbi:DUF257 family protein [Thermococcus radiotolerans]|uniref:Uncharacterized protein n=1 Tax=Thermococcus radiotolerans TaxID=187880 RepID=A0A2Z2MUW8_9EURY|nr:DUF257 family protein [Thermococcus radiotolerans]ASJ13735.1 hypothetical protein A3L10_00795 [Thermococcus radiotolerans]
MTANKAVEEAIESIGLLQPGEVVVVEYDSLAPVHLAASIALLDLSGERHIIVNDIFDQLHVIRAHLSIIGVDTGWMDEIPVIKFGGVLHTGNVIKRISVLKAASIWHREYLEALEASRGLKFVVTLGLEKLITVKTDIPSASMCRMCMASSMGSEDVIMMAFVNREMLPESALEDIRELASRVFELSFRDGRLVLRVVKSPALERYGSEFSVSASELVEYLKGRSGGK